MAYARDSDLFSNLTWTLWTLFSFLVEQPSILVRQLLEISAPIVRFRAHAAS